MVLIAKKDFVATLKKSVRLKRTLTDGEAMKKRILNRSRLRAVQGGFAFIPHRFLQDGFMKRLDPQALLLYLFLIMVSDAYGLSYYGDASLCRLLRMNASDLALCRQTLIEADLIAFDAPLVQVLELPRKPVSTKDRIQSIHSSSPSSFSQLSQTLRD